MQFSRTAAIATLLAVKAIYGCIALAVGSATSTADKTEATMASVSHSSGAVYNFEPSTPIATTASGAAPVIDRMATQSAHRK